MNSVRLWIVLLAVVSFLAGIAGGVLVTTEMLPAPRQPGPFHDYAALFTDRFELSVERERGLRAILDRYHRDIEDVKSKHAAGMEPELVKLGDVCADRIRHYVIPEDQRADFDQLALGITPAPSPR